MSGTARIKTASKEGHRGGDAEPLDRILAEQNSELDRLMAAIDSTLDEIEQIQGRRTFVLHSN